MKFQSPRFVIGAFLVSIAWTGLSSALAAPADLRFQNAEYAFQLRFPATPTKSKVCAALSGDHPHGFYAWYGGRHACNRSIIDPTTSSISMFADYNAAFETSPRTLLPDTCRAAKSNDFVGEAELHTLSFRGHKSVSCATAKPDGSIVIQVVTQAGKWPAPGNDPDLQTPWINYDATLVTRPGRIQKDLALFKLFLASIEIKF